MSHYNLTNEQISLLKEIQTGKTYKEIAFENNISESSMKRKFGSIFNKIGVINLQDFLRKYGNAQIVE